MRLHQHRYLLSALIASVLFLVSPGYTFGGEGANFRLTILHVNDTHSHLEDELNSIRIDLDGDGAAEKYYVPMGSFPRLASKVKQSRIDDANTLFLHAGDLIQGTIYFTRYKGEADVRLMNMMKPDAMAVGNHEYDKGPETLAALIEQADFPVLSCNTTISGDLDLKKRIVPYKIIEVGGEKVGVFGLITPETSTSSSPGPEVAFGDLREAAKKAVKELESMGVNKIIALTHIGYNHDLLLAAKTSGIDVIVGGHSHSLLGDFDNLGWRSEGPYPSIINNEKGEPVVIVQAWKWAYVLGRLDVEFDREGRVAAWAGRPAVLAGKDILDSEKAPLESEKKSLLIGRLATGKNVEFIDDDPEAVRLLASYKQGVEEYRRVVVGYAEKDLLNVRVPGMVHKTGITLEKGSQVAPVVCESVYWKTNQVGLKVDAVVQNAGGVRDDILQGDVTLADLYKVLPFGNTIYVLELTGNELAESLNYGYGKSGGAHPYVYGLRKKENGASAGWKAADMDVRTADGWSKLNPEKTYRIATNSFLAGGGDGYDIFKTSGAARLDTGFVDVDVLKEYVESKPEGILRNSK